MSCLIAPLKSFIGMRNKHLHCQSRLTIKRSKYKTFNTKPTHDMRILSTWGLYSVPCSSVAVVALKAYSLLRSLLFGPFEGLFEQPGGKQTLLSGRTSSAAFCQTFRRLCVFCATTATTRRAAEGATAIRGPITSAASYGETTSMSWRSRVRQVAQGCMRNRIQYLLCLSVGTNA